MLLCAVLIARNLIEAYGPKSLRAAVQCENPRHEFVELQAGQLVHNTFAIESVDGKPLTITGIKLGCGCTTIEPSKSEFPKKLRSW